MCDKNKKRTLVLSVVVTMLGTVGCSGLNEAATGSMAVSSEASDIIFVGNNIITVDELNEGATAVAVRDGRIVRVGDSKAVMELRGAETRIVELGEQALIPGFIDSHGHVAASARFVDFVNLSSPPVGKAERIADIVSLLKNHRAESGIGPEEWIVGYGYDDALLAENRHPTRDDLDAVSTSNPIFLLHVSGHLGSANSAALDTVGINSNSDDPAGGVIRRREGSREPNGVLEESAIHKLAYGRLADFSDEKLELMLRDALLQYASYGITTVQDGAANPADIARFRTYVTKQPFPIDIVAYQFATSIPTEQFDSFEHEANYTGGYRVGGVKFSVDGSPQGRTAWMTQPYTEGPPGASVDYTAYPTVEPDSYLAQFSKMIERKVPVLVHANGDAAIDLMLTGLEGALADKPETDHRSVIIHAQLMRADQLDKAASLEAIPSFFSAHTFFWGDWHVKSFGMDRAKNISPARWTADRNMKFTIHNDSPVVPPDMMRLLWATVNRTTRSGRVLGPEQRLSVVEAIKAATLTGAYQLFEEDEKGSITEGKRADLVILASDPRSGDPDELKDIAVVETLAGGKTVFRRD